MHCLCVIRSSHTAKQCSSGCTCVPCSVRYALHECSLRCCCWACSCDCSHKDLITAAATWHAAWYYNASIVVQDPVWFWSVISTPLGLVLVTHQQQVASLTFGQSSAAPSQSGSGQSSAVPSQFSLGQSSATPSQFCCGQPSAAPSQSGFGQSSAPPIQSGFGQSSAASGQSSFGQSPALGAQAARPQTVGCCVSEAKQCRCVQLLLVLHHA